MPPYSSVGRQRTGSLRRKPISAWKRPGVWFRIVIAAFFFNLIIAIVTVERHISLSTTTTLKSLEMMDRPRISPLRRKSGQGEFLTESRIWHRMLLQQEQKKQDVLCSKRKNQTEAAKPGAMQFLPPFGFPESVRAYVREHETNKTSPQGLPSTYCLAPPSEPSCESSQYTVVIYSSGYAMNRANNDVGTTDTNANGYWRNIVVAVMKFLAYPSVQRVNLVLQEEEIDSSSINTLSTGNSAVNKRQRTTVEVSAKRNKYAKRVLNWSRKGDVNVVSALSLWDAIDRLEVPSESLLWIDGDYSDDLNLQTKISNNTMLNNRFHGWREKPNALVIPTESGLFPLPLSNINHENIKGSDDDSLCLFPLLHEMMMHTNYLCYLNHPVVGSELRNYTKSLRQKDSTNDSPKKDYDENRVSWDITILAMGMLLFSVGDGYVIEDANPLSAPVHSAHSSRSPLHSAVGGSGILARYTEDISNYFGCRCSVATSRLSPPNTWQCLSD